MHLSCLEAPTTPDRGDIVQFQVSRPAVSPRRRPCVRSKRLRNMMTRTLTSPGSGKSFVTMNAVFHCVYLAWKHPRRRIEFACQVSRPAFPPRTRPCERSKRLRSTMHRTLTSPDSVVSPQSQRAQFSIAFISPRSSHAAGSRRYFRSVDPLFHHEHGLACGQRD